MVSEINEVPQPLEAKTQTSPNIISNPAQKQQKTGFLKRILSRFQHKPITAQVDNMSMRVEALRKRIVDIRHRKSVDKLAIGDDVEEEKALDQIVKLGHEWSDEERKWKAEAVARRELKQGESPTDERISILEKQLKTDQMPLQDDNVQMKSAA